MCIPACTGTDTPPDRHPSSQTPPWADTSWSDTPSADTPKCRHPQCRHPPEQTPPLGRQEPPGRHPLAQCMLGYTHSPTQVHAGIHPPCQVHTVIQTPLPSACWDTPPPPSPNPSDGHCSGRYVSYWNAILFKDHLD